MKFGRKMQILTSTTLKWQKKSQFCKFKTTEGRHIEHICRP